MTDHEPLARDIAANIPESRPVTSTAGKRLGLVVGIDLYSDPSISDLAAAEADAAAMHALMVDPRCGMFIPELTAVLIGPDATQRNMSRAFERLSKSALSDDEIWIYFAGHGVLQRGEHRLLPFDAERDHLESSTVRLAEYLRLLKCKRRVVFLDCCHSGAVEPGTRNVHSVDHVLGSYDAEGTVIYCSSESEQRSVELPDLRRGAFSYWIERGLRGEADADSNGLVTSDELWSFVLQRVEQDSIARTQIRQTPRIKLDSNGVFALSVCALTTPPRGEAAPITPEPLHRIAVVASAHDAASRAPLSFLLHRAERGDHDAAADAAVRLSRDGASANERTRIVAALKEAARSGAPAAQRVLAEWRERGDFVARDPEEALELRRRAASSGDASSALWMARRESDSSMRFRWMRDAAEQGMAEAQFELSTMFATGAGCPRDQREQQRWAIEAAEQGFLPAVLLLATQLRSSDPEAATRWTIHAAELGDAEAQYTLASMYSLGRGVPHDPSQALTYCRRAAAQGHPEALRHLATFEFRHDIRDAGSGAVAVPPSVPSQTAYAAELQEIEADARRGSAAAQCKFAECLLNGTGITADRSRGIRWLRIAAESGDPHAMDKYVAAMLTDPGDQAAIADCTEFLRAFANRGATHALWLLADTSLSGRLPSVATNEAVQILLQLASVGHPQGLCSLGVCLFEGKGVPRDLAAAFRSFERAASAGSVTGAYCLGVCLAEGLGTQRDPAAALEHFERAAQHGDADACHRVADAYYRGLGAIRDLKLAMHWFFRAADAGSTQSQYRLGAQYERGVGLPRDTALAREWYRKAAAAGHCLALAALDRLGDTAHPAQRR